jgi:hypothetical protein
MVLFVPEGAVSLAYDEYGNPVEQRPAIAQYLLSVTEDNQQPVLKSNPGLDTATTTYSGRCMGKVKDTSLKEPDLYAPANIDSRARFLPSTLVSNKRFDCEITDPATKEKQKGSFVILSAFQSRFRVVTKVLGSRINGYFEFGR